MALKQRQIDFFHDNKSGQLNQAQNNFIHQKTIHGTAHFRTFVAENHKGSSITPKNHSNMAC